MPTTTVRKKKFSPIAGARAMGYRAASAMMIVATAAEMHVAAMTAPKSIPACDSTAGCTKMM